MKSFRNEEWKVFDLVDCYFEKEEILISNYGRVLKKKKGADDFSPQKTGIINNFETFPYRNAKDKLRNYYVHRAVALLFIPKAEDKKFVIHKDHDLRYNYYKNLQWVNQKELTAHQLKNPKRIESAGAKHSAKLTEVRVRVIKKILSNPNRKTRMRIIAKQFGISTMQLYRIKSGENWGDVKI